MRIPFNRPFTPPDAEKSLLEAVATGKYSGDGEFAARCHEFLERQFSVPRALLTPSCTHALEMAALLLELDQHDEVIVPTYTFVSTANAFLLRGCRLVFADCRPDTLNLDESILPEIISDRTRAIVVMHYGGIACEMERIMAVADEYGLAVVEDNAHGIFGRYRGRYLGTFGALSTLSFHETKNISCGEGGALLVNNPEMIERAEIIREKGTNRTQFFQRKVDRYSWIDLGSSYLTSEFAAAFLYSQFLVKTEIQSNRRRIWEKYFDSLEDWANENEVSLPTVPVNCEQSYHLFYMVLPEPGSRDRLISHLKQRGILAVFHYVPLHNSPMGKRLGNQDGQCPVAERISARLIRLPMYNDMTPEIQEEVIDAVTSFVL